MLTRRKLLDLAGKGLVMAGRAGALLNGAGAKGAWAFSDEQAAPAKPRESTSAAEENYLRQPPRFNDSRDRFLDKRFGLFTHWGSTPWAAGTPRRTTSKG